MFWKDPWLDDLALKHKFRRLYALDNYKQITVVEKINHTSMVDTFRRPPIGSAEEEQLGFLLSRMDGLILTNIPDRWVLSLEATLQLNMFVSLLMIRFFQMRKSPQVPKDLLPDVFTAKNLTTMVNATHKDMAELVDLLTRHFKNNMLPSPPPSANVEGEKFTNDECTEVNDKSPFFLYSADKDDHPATLAPKIPAPVQGRQESSGSSTDTIFGNGCINQLKMNLHQKD
nr:hypothetical protein [Tanacetum cinerariifolium]